MKNIGQENKVRVTLSKIPFRFCAVVIVVFYSENNYAMRTTLWTVPQMSFMIIIITSSLKHYYTWSILIQQIRIILSGDNLTQKTQKKDPSQAFTKSKQIYRIGWSLKFCGTVHYRHVMCIHTAKLSQSRLIMLIIQIEFHLETSLCMYLVQTLTLVGLINHEANARSNYPCRPPPDCDDVSPSVSYPVCTGVNSL